MLPYPVSKSVARNAFIKRFNDTIPSSPTRKQLGDTLGFALKDIDRTDGKLCYYIRREEAMKQILAQIIPGFLEHHAHDDTFAEALYTDLQYNKAHEKTIIYLGRDLVLDNHVLYFGAQPYFQTQAEITDPVHGLEQLLDHLIVEEQEPGKVQSIFEIARKNQTYRFGIVPLMDQSLASLTKIAIERNTEEAVLRELVTSAGIIGGQAEELASSVLADNEHARFNVERAACAYGFSFTDLVDVYRGVITQAIQRLRAGRSVDDPALAKKEVPLFGTRFRDIPGKLHRRPIRNYALELIAYDLLEGQTDLAKQESASIRDYLDEQELTFARALHEKYDQEFETPDQFVEQPIDRPESIQNAGRSLTVLGALLQETSEYRLKKALRQKQKKIYLAWGKVTNPRSTVSADEISMQLAKGFEETTTQNARRVIRAFKQYYISEKENHNPRDDIYSTIRASQEDENPYSLNHPRFYLRRNSRKATIDDMLGPSILLSIYSSLHTFINWVVVPAQKETGTPHPKKVLYQPFYNNIESPLARAKKEGEKRAALRFMQHVANREDTAQTAKEKLQDDKRLERLGYLVTSITDKKIQYKRRFHGPEIVGDVPKGSYKKMPNEHTPRVVLYLARCMERAEEILGREISH